MRQDVNALEGRHIRLEPLSLAHLDALVAASEGGAELYRWTQVPSTREAMEAYVRAALTAQEEGRAVPFATVRRSDARVIGSTRFCHLDYWSWPEGHARFGRRAPDVCEIGYTWLAPEAVRTRANTEAKLLMLSHAFEVWKLFSVCFHTDMRNERSRAALARIGARFEGTLRSHRLGVDLAPRDSARFSITAAEWPSVRSHLLRKLEA